MRERSLTTCERAWDEHGEGGRRKWSLSECSLYNMYRLRIRMEKGFDTNRFPKPRRRVRDKDTRVLVSIRKESNPNTREYNNKKRNEGQN